MGYPDQMYSRIPSEDRGVLEEGWDVETLVARLSKRSVGWTDSGGLL